MAVKDKAYAEHLKALELDRPKEFSVPPTTTEEYVREWCKKNGLVHGAPTKKKRRKKL